MCNISKNEFIGRNNLYLDHANSANGYENFRPLRANVDLKKFELKNVL